MEPFKQEHIINSIGQIKLKMDQTVEVVKDLHSVVTYNLCRNVSGNINNGLNSEILQLFLSIE